MEHWGWGLLAVQPLHAPFPQRVRQREWSPGLRLPPDAAPSSQGDLLGGPGLGRACMWPACPLASVWEGTEAGSGLGPSLVRGTPFLRASTGTHRAWGSASGQRESPKAHHLFPPPPRVRGCAVPRCTGLPSCWPRGKERLEAGASSGQFPTPQALSTVLSPVVSAGSGQRHLMTLKKQAYHRRKWRRWRAEGVPQSLLPGQAHSVLEKSFCWQRAWGPFPTFSELCARACACHGDPGPTVL